jgi:hypothetical protein
MGPLVELLFMSLSGTIAAYAPEVRHGVIKTRNGKFVFARQDWIGECEPRVNMVVRFETENRLAYDVIAAPAGTSLKGVRTHPAFRRQAGPALRLRPKPLAVSAIRFRSVAQRVTA